MTATRRAPQILLALVPLACTPDLVIALAEGLLNLGGGEKDLLLALPWTIGAAVFAVAAIVQILRSAPPAPWIPRAIACALGVLLALAAVAYFTSTLGIA